MGGAIHESVGDNKEFGVEGTREFTVYFGSNNTSANDTETSKYFDNNAQYNDKSMRLITIRAEASFEIVGYNGINFTDPLPVTIGDGTSFPATAFNKEDFDGKAMISITIRTTQASGSYTNFGIRWRG